MSNDLASLEGLAQRRRREAGAPSTGRGQLALTICENEKRQCSNGKGTPAGASLQPDLKAEDFVSYPHAHGFRRRREGKGCF